MILSLRLLPLYLSLMVFASGEAPPLATGLFDEAQFARIRFLEGRWKGIGPDGKEFFEEYVLTGPTRFEANRHGDASFSERKDGSTVTLQDGVILSTWGRYTWKAVSLTDTKACFEPMNAPSSFCWERISPETVTVTQRWNGEDGKEQSYVLTLTRVSK
ncbi:hypothetical protein Verru16b_01481 [Lacunisphaera limnophila]|uniref:DUF1579 domain-containing protein n=1 Tax=Lacunisphaera limnophila TaxID=1838286 RepID=A0A1D8AU56_9BACT|nr:hypothetical protein [Lacunisphaera limnophila]AOS44419.1 hypothetical protein Verru16b_01481 [Lacunisphaera limnophila]